MATYRCWRTAMPRAIARVLRINIFCAIENPKTERSHLSMLRSAMKGLKSVGGRTSDAGQRRMARRISVEGFDTSLHEYEVMLTLRKHFSSCGEVKRVYLPTDYENGVLERFAFVYIEGEDAEDKALALSRSEVRGWTLFVKASPFETGDTTDPILGGVFDPGCLREPDSRQERQFFVSGYYTSLPEIDIQIGLCNYFSSCGEITHILVIKDRYNKSFSRNSIVSIVGEGAVEKALQLSGRNIGGWSLTILGVMPVPGTTKGISCVNSTSFLPTE